MWLNICEEFVQQVCKPFIKILHFLLFQNLKIPNFFKQDGGSFIINKFIEEPLELPPTMD